MFNPSLNCRIDAVVAREADAIADHEAAEYRLQKTYSSSHYNLGQQPLRLEQGKLMQEKLKPHLKLLRRNWKLLLLRYLSAMLIDDVCQLISL